jgi:hypothetical protein
MKNPILTIIALFSLLTAVGQNGMKNGNLFLLLTDKTTLSVNSFANEKIHELQKFPCSERSLYATDQIENVAVLDAAKNSVTISNLKTSGELKLPIPFDIKPKTILLNSDNLFIGGEMGKEILIQYHIRSAKWYKLEIPNEVSLRGKAIDDLVVKDSLLIAIDNIVMPKYVLFYRLNPKGKSDLLHYKQLKNNGAYESIRAGRITETYFGVLSSTYSGYVGATNHITIYDNLDLTRSFALSSNQYDKNHHTFTDFVIIGNQVVIAGKENGLGIFEIHPTYFKESNEYSDGRRNHREDISKIRYTKYDDQVIIKLTVIPNTNKVILTLEDKQGAIKHETVAI